MAAKLAQVIAVFCLFYALIDCSFIKPNNVPRVGRSNEGEPFDQDSLGYVIKTNKNIPRIGRRNYDSENRYDIPKFYQLPAQSFDPYQAEQSRYNQEQMEAYYTNQLENMKKK